MTDVEQTSRDLAYEIVTSYGDADYWQNTEDEPIDAIQGIEMALRAAEQRGAEKMHEADRRAVAPISGEALSALHDLDPGDVLNHEEADDG